MASRGARPKFGSAKGLVEMSEDFDEPLEDFRVDPSTGSRIEGRGEAMNRLKLSEDLRPFSDLEAQPAEVVEQARETGRPVVLTREGRGIAVLLSIEAFEELQTFAEERQLQRAVAEAEQDIAAGNWVEHDDVETKLRRWAGEP